MQIKACIPNILQLLRRSNKGMTNHRGHASHHGHRPCVTQGLFETPTLTLSDHLGLIISSIERSPTGPRKEMLCAAASSTCLVLRGNQESSPGRLRPSLSLHGCRHSMSVSWSVSAFSPLQDIQHTRTVQAQVLPVASRRRQPALLTQLHHPTRPRNREQG